MKRFFTVVLSITLALAICAPASAQDLNLGKCTANLSSAYSNNKSVDWYYFVSPYYPAGYDMQVPPKILCVTSDNSIYLKMDYQLRDDSSFRGESQAANIYVYHYNPATYSWLDEGGTGSSHGSATWGKYNQSGTMSKLTWWDSTSKAIKFQIRAEAKSGDTVSKTRYLWVVRKPANTSAAYQAGPRWMVTRYERSALYHEMAQNWRELGTSSTSGAFQDGMNRILTLSTGFGTSTAQDLAVETGLDSLGIINTLWGASNVTSEVLDSTGIIYQGYTWVTTAINLLGSGLRDSIVAATSPTMMADAASDASALATSLDSVASAALDEAAAEQAVLYSGGSVSTWKQKLQAEKTAINNALTAVSNARSAISSSLSSYTGTNSGGANWNQLPGGVGSGLNSSATQVSTQLNQYLNGVEDQLKFDQALINKASSL
jgi:hypothetical protein